jgi:hypothetical protein
LIFRDAVRGLRRDRAYTLTVIGTLALTIGATTAVFSIVNGVLLKPLAYRESHQLVAGKEIWRQRADRTATLEVNEQHFEYWRRHTRTFESLAQYIVLPANLTGVGDATQINVGRVSGTLFEVLQVQAALGRRSSPIAPRRASGRARNPSAEGSAGAFPAKTASKLLASSPTRRSRRSSGRRHSSRICRTGGRRQGTHARARRPRCSSKRRAITHR